MNRVNIGPINQLRRTLAIVLHTNRFPVYTQHITLMSSQSMPVCCHVFH